LFLLAFLRTKARYWLVWQFIGMLAGGFIYLVFNYFSIDSNSYGLSSITKRAFDDSGRLSLWQSAFDMIKHHPLLGIGPMHFAFNNSAIAAHPHNSVLQIAAEYGLPALLIACYLVATLLKNAVVWCNKPAHNENTEINIALTASLVCGLSDSLLSGNIIMPHSQMMLFMIGGWLIGRNQSLFLTNSNLPTANKHWQNLMLIAVVLSLTTIQVNGVQSYYNYMKNRQFSVQEYSHPRFWSDGHRRIDILISQGGRQQ
jgi:O-antigen ligase